MTPLIYTDSNIIKIDNKFILEKDSKIAAFDLDHTIIKPKHNKVYSADRDDWEFFNDTVVTKLHLLHKLGYCLVIISNQAKVKQIWIDKMRDVIAKINLPILVIASIDKNMFRKPAPTIWNKYFPNNKEGSFYCGDAAGNDDRIINSIMYKKDFADTDAKFAINCGIDFVNRDDFIVKNESCYYNNKNYTITYPDLTIKNDNVIDPYNITKTLIINVGIPGSGKSTFTKKYYPGFVYINSDTQTQKEIKQAIKEAISKDKSIVIDNTNSAIKKRKEFIDIFKNKSYKIICHHFDTDMDIAKHNNYYRAFKSNDVIKRVPDVAYNVYNSRFEQPSINEGFDKIVTIKYNRDNDDPDYNLYFF